MPALFLGHGNPMNAVRKTRWSEAWRAIGPSLPRPRAILSVSAHWYVPGLALTAQRIPPTIHDFGGFPEELFQVDYPAPGDPALAARVRQLLPEAGLDETWGLDHGTWSVLVHLFPKADVPVVQLSLDRTKTAADHRALGQRLAPLRDEGILVLGSGNVVHNLHAYAWGEPSAQPYDWAVSFDRRVRDALIARDEETLASFEKPGEAVPTPDHYLPLLYVAALRGKDDPVTFPVEGFDGGSISMLAVRIG
jgi:4,5-DOPA dioxygenase extradiol